MEETRRTKQLDTGQGASFKTQRGHAGYLEMTTALSKKERVAVQYRIATSPISLPIDFSRSHG